MPFIILTRTNSQEYHPEDFLESETETTFSHFGDKSYVFKSRL